VRPDVEVGTWLRGFTFGHLRQLDKVCGEVLARAWAGAEPGDGPLVVDVDSQFAAQTRSWRTQQRHMSVA
jgi:hypothetical protein